VTHAVGWSGSHGVNGWQVLLVVSHFWVDMQQAEPHWCAAGHVALQ
jgi:hypothetical protein